VCSRANGAVPIDNNVGKREMKCVVLHRKKLAVRPKPERRTGRSGLGQLDQQLRPARDGSATLLMQLLDAWLPDRWKKAHAARCGALEISPLDS